MKTYQVEFKRTSYITLTIPAKSLEDAQEAAWEELEEGEYGLDDAEWEITEIK